MGSNISFYELVGLDLHYKILIYKLKTLRAVLFRISTFQCSIKIEW